MTDDRSLERAARSWLEDGPTRAPEQAVDAALGRIQTTPQERGLRVPWRMPTMNPIARLAAAAVVAAIAVGGSLYLVGRDLSIGGPPPPGPTATPTAVAATSAPSPTENLGACRLITSAEAAAMAGDVGLGALPGQTGAGDETACVYRDGGGNPVLHLDYIRVGGADAFAVLTKDSSFEPVADLGDDAVYNPEIGELHVLQGDSLVAILPSGRNLDDRLNVAVQFAELVLERL